MIRSDAIAALIVAGLNAVCTAVGIDTGWVAVADGTGPLPGRPRCPVKLGVESTVAGFTGRNENAGVAQNCLLPGRFVFTRRMAQHDIHVKRLLAKRNGEDLEANLGGEPLEKRAVCCAILPGRAGQVGRGGGRGEDGFTSLGKLGWAVVDYTVKPSGEEACH